MKKKNGFLLLLLTGCLVFYACKKNFSDEQYIPDNTTKLPDLTSTITASVSGFITDQNGAAVSGAQVTGGTQTATTNLYGYFKLSNISLGKLAGFVKVSMAGYFSGYRTFIANAGKETFIRLQLIPKTAVGTINAVTGGSASTTDGGIVTLPVNAVVVASNNMAYTGTVHVAVYWINPAADNLQRTMPGNLLGIDTAGYLKALTTYGMLAVELTDDAGDLLQIATGKHATLSFPILSSLTASAPASIALWSFNETNGLWKQEDSAIKNGSNYVGNVSHFSYWNCDIGQNAVSFTTQIVNSALSPVSNVPVEISYDNQPNASRIAYTDTSGFVYGIIPGNSDLTLTVLNACNTSIYSKSFTTANANVDFGTIAVNLGIIEFDIVGTVVDCNNAPITNGNVIIAGVSGLNYYADIHNGEFKTTILSCSSNSLSASLIAIDNGTNQQTPLQSINLTPGLNKLDTISICNISQDQYVTVSVDGGVPVSFVVPLNVTSVAALYSGGITAIRSITSNLDTLNITFQDSLATGNNFTMVDKVSNPIGSSLLRMGTDRYSNLTAGLMNITEYGVVGNFISGNFTCTFNIWNGTAQVHSVTCSFRVKRTG